MNVAQAVCQISVQKAAQSQSAVQEMGEHQAQDTKSAKSFQEYMEQQCGMQDKGQAEDKHEEGNQIPDQAQSQLNQVVPAAMEMVLSEWMIPDTLGLDCRWQAQQAGQTGQTFTAGLGVGLEMLTAKDPAQVTAAWNGQVEVPEIQQQSGEQTQPGIMVSDRAQPHVVMDAVNQSAQWQQAEQSLSQLQEMAEGTSGQEKENNSQVFVVESSQRPVFGHMEAMPVQVGETSVDLSVSPQQADVNLAQALHGAVEQGSQYVKLTLTPEHLGSVVAEFTQSPEGVLHVMLHAETEQTMRILEEHVQSLGVMLQEKGNGPVQIEVNQSQAQTGHQFDHDGSQQQHARQQPRQHAPEKEHESFIQQLRLGLVELEQG